MNQAIIAWSYYNSPSRVGEVSVVQGDVTHVLIQNQPGAPIRLDLGCVHKDKPSILDKCSVDKKSALHSIPSFLFVAVPKYNQSLYNEKICQWRLQWKVWLEGPLSTPVLR